MSAYEAYAQQLCDSMSRVAKVGVEAGIEIERRRTEAVLLAYDKALQDPNTKIPTMLHVALEALRTK